MAGAIESVSYNMVVRWESYVSVAGSHLRETIDGQRGAIEYGPMRHELLAPLIAERKRYYEWLRDLAIARHRSASTIAGIKASHEP